jgi:hypothetical protein
MALNNDLYAFAGSGANDDRTGNNGTTVPGKQNTVESSKNILENRTRNPLSVFSSYTYQITLYMISPGAYNAFVESGRTNINAIGTAQSAPSRTADSNEGVFIVAQSGGINRKENRAPYLDVDYYIDDLRIESNITGQSTRSATNSVDVKFKITEPYGFSFLTNLKLASETLKKTKSGIQGYNSVDNALKQFFILGIRFIGYDADGKIMTRNAEFPGRNVSTNLSGDSLFETFYDIYIAKLNFKLDGRATTYNIESKVIGSYVGFGIKYGRINNNTEINAGDVQSALNQLAERLNEFSNQSDVTAKTKYEITYAGDVTQLQQAKFYNEADLNKLRSTMSAAKTTAEVTDATALVKATPKLETKKISIKSDTSVLQQIDDIITQSQYLIDALSVVYTANLQAKGGTNKDNERTQNNNKEVMWYHISAEVTVGAFDISRQDYSYNIKYIIEPYKTPVVTAAYVPKTTKYYGPHKRYDYYFTGQNSEIIEYTQTYNNAFFTVMAEKDPTPGSQSNATQNNQSSTSYNKQQDESKLNYIDREGQSANAYRTSLYDPSAYASAKIVILGDPDYLIQESTSTVSRVYNQFYGPGSTINANGGQVFIEINFNEAVDYDNTGLLEVNDKILFWKYPKDVAPLIKGVAFLVVKVISNFSKGKFTQELNCNLPPFAEGSGGGSNRLTEGENQSAAETTRLSRSSTTSSSQITTPPINSANPAPAKTTTAVPNQRTVPTKVNSVADDDSGNQPPSPFQVGA